jgi:hypothetical protein
MAVMDMPEQTEGDAPDTAPGNSTPGYPYNTVDLYCQIQYLPTCWFQIKSDGTTAAGGSQLGIQSSWRDKANGQCCSRYRTGEQHS